MKALWNLIEDELGTNISTDNKLRDSVKKLSHLFTEGRENLSETYLSKYNEAYLAYYVPLNFDKVRTILSSNKTFWSTKPLAHPHWIDFGCGPGTAALAAMASMRDFYGPQGKLPPISIDLVDTQPEALEKAKHLVTQFAERLSLKATVKTFTEIPSDHKYTLSLAANVLNELPGEDDAHSKEILLQLWAQTEGALFVLEPGHRVSSQRLVRFRERLLKEATTESNNIEILGPCTHLDKCPVNRTKHWCHFSEPVSDGRLLDLNMRIFKSPRSWLKFSYLLVRRAQKPVTATWDGKTFRAIGDLHQSGPHHLAIDLCKPNEKYVHRISQTAPNPVKKKLVRGALVILDPEKTKPQPKVIVKPRK